MQQNFIVALVDKSFNMLATNELGLTTKIANIVEHDSRLDDISQECQFFIDEDMYKALGFQGVPFKYTKVFVENTNDFQNQKSCKFFDIRFLDDQVKKYNSFNQNKPLFFMGGASFSKYVMQKLANKLLLTVVDLNVDNGFCKFPIDEAKQQFKGRKTIEPVLLKDIKKYKKEFKRKQGQNFIIAENGAKLFKEPEEPKYSDEILNTPNYMFYEFRK